MAEAFKIARGRPKRPTIGFFVNDLAGDYSEALCRGIIDAAAAHDVNLIVFPGQSLKIPYSTYYNYNMIYEYVNDSNLDGLVMATTVLCGFISRDEFMAFYSRYQSLPVVSIGIPIEGIPSVLIDNRTGFKQVLNHLIKDHGKRRIAFIKGPDKHIDAQERFLVYRDVLAENGLEFDPDLVVPGDFTVNLAPQAMELLYQREVRYDAIAAANDIMAFKALQILGDRHIRVPEQVAITGFDNGKRGKHTNPSLTTVKQPIYEQSQKALEMVLELINGKQPDNVVLDTEIVIRESCGCCSEALQSFQNHPIDFQVKAAIDDQVELDVIIERFMEQNLGKIDERVIKHSSMQMFITNCIHVLTRDGLEPREAEKLFRGFQSLIDVPDLEASDIFAIQNVITILKKWIDPLTENKNRLIIEDFFQKLRVLVADIAIKMKGSRLNTYHSELYQLRGVLVEMVSKIHDYQEQLHSIIPRLRAMHINNCYVYLYDQPVRYRCNEVWQNPPTVELVMAYNCENPCLEDSRRLPWEKVFNHEFLPRNNRYTLMLNPLFVEEEHLGLILMDFYTPNNYLFESLMIEMSCALRLSLLFYEREQIDKRLHEVVQELEEYNRKLKNISQTDELTGLYNRRGFLNLAKRSLDQARKQGKGGLVFFGDMDGLKKINDQYGHDEGDIAIKAMAKILIKTFWASDIIARLGGDEFTIFTVGTDLQLLPKLKDRLLEYIGEYNKQAGKPYQLSITIGAIPFHSGEDARTPVREGTPVTLENLLSQADKLLYEEKKQKKSPE